MAGADRGRRTGNTPRARCDEREGIAGVCFRLVCPACVRAAATAPRAVTPNEKHTSRMSSSRDERDVVPMDWDELQSRKDDAAELRRVNELEAEAGLPEGVLALAIGRGGQTNNMAPVTSHWAESVTFEGSRTAAGGLDWLAWSAVAGFDDWASMREELEAAHEAAIEHGKPVNWEIRGVRCVVHPHGTGKGTNHRRYLLQALGSTFSIADREPSKGSPNVFVETRGETLLAIGLHGVLEHVDTVLSTWRCFVGETFVSRVDLRVDVVGLKVGEAIKSFTDQNVVRQSRKFAMFGDGLECQTLQIGAKGASCQMRIYDKIAELKGQDNKVELMKNAVWGGAVPESSTRIEFQLRREKLTDLKVFTLTDLLQSMGRVSHYLTFEWFRAVDDCDDRTHTSRAKVSEWWKRVRGQFEAFTSAFVVGEKSKQVKGGTDAVKMYKQAAGCLKRAFAEMGELPMDAHDACQGLIEMVASDFQSFLDGVAEKLPLADSLSYASIFRDFAIEESGQLRAVA